MLAALAHVQEAYAKAPPPPLLANDPARPVSGVAPTTSYPAPPAVFEAEQMRQLDQFERDLEVWETGLEESLQELEASFRIGPVHSGHLENLTNLIDHISLACGQSRIDLENTVRNMEKKGRQAERLSKEVGKTIRRVTGRMKRLLGQEHDVQVRYYYRLLALRAEHDPDARGGITFDSPADLDAFLRHAAE